MVQGGLAPFIGGFSGRVGGSLKWDFNYTLFLSCAV